MEEKLVVTEITIVLLPIDNEIRLYSEYYLSFLDIMYMGMLVQVGIRTVVSRRNLRCMGHDRVKTP